MDRARQAAALTACGLLLAATPTSAQAGPYEVTTDVMTDEATQDIHVWAPAAGGEFPVVYALHGTGGDGTDWDVIGPALAARGVVVFASDYHSLDVGQGRLDRVLEEAECGYRYVRSIAEDYGGDLDQPVTFAGHSLGASMVLWIGLDVGWFGAPSSFGGCFAAVERPDVIVGLGGCHYEYQGRWHGFDPATFGPSDASVILVSADDDDICAPWQSVDASGALAAAGYDSRYVDVAGANHMSLIGYDHIDGEWLSLPDDPTTARVVLIILDAVHKSRATPDP